ncbi:MAG: hypothetical protein PHG55_04875 [Verrucomicrobiota bacterium]|nr:hypothetical protein [Verrucomicrobiota bacterium]
MVVRKGQWQGKARQGKIGVGGAIDPDFDFDPDFDPDFDSDTDPTDPTDPTDRQPLPGGGA